MAVATLLRHTDLGEFGHLLIATHFLDRAVSAMHIDPAVTLAVLVISHIGGNRIMALLEFLMKPPLDAQRAAGRSEVNAEFEEWKKRQRASGVEFVDDDDEPERDQPPTHDQ